MQRSHFNPALHRKPNTGRLTEMHLHHKFITTDIPKTGNSVRHIFRMPHEDSMLGKQPKQRSLDTLQDIPEDSIPVDLTHAKT